MQTAETSCHSKVAVDAFRHHGGRLAMAKVRWPLAPSPWLDLSTGVNACAYPAPRATRVARTRLPDPADLAALEAVAAAAFGLPAERVCATAGAQAALHLLAATLSVRTVAIAAPTYGGHAHAWATAGARVEPWTRLEHGSGSHGEPIGAAILVNPNNPDGRRIPAETVVALAARMEREKRWLVVDESFVETEPELSVAAAAGGPLIVIRSFGKFYGLAGLRLGFVLAEPELLVRLRARQGDWPISADALAAGGAAYADLAWAGRTRRRLERDATRLDGLLRASGYEVLGGTSLFRYVGAPDAAARFERLASRGVLVRPFDHAPDRLRFGLPPRTGWTRLNRALEERHDARA